MAEKEQTLGHVVQVIGPVVDVQFPEHHLPHIYNAVRVVSEGFNVPEPIDIICEVQQHLGEGRVRTVALKPSEGLVRGMKAYDTGSADFRSGGPPDARAGAERTRRAGGWSGPGKSR